MEPIPQKSISEMRRALEAMDISPMKKAEISLLLNKIESKNGLALNELKKLGKMLDTEEKQVRTEIKFAKMARKMTDKFVKKTDQIFSGYLGALKKSNK